MPYNVGVVAFRQQLSGLNGESNSIVVKVDIRGASKHVRIVRLKCRGECLQCPESGFSATLQDSRHALAVRSQKEVATTLSGIQRLKIDGASLRNSVLPLPPGLASLDK